MTKKYKLFILLAVLFLAFFVYQRDYSVSNNSADIEKNIQHLLNIKSDKNWNPSIKKIVELGGTNTTVVLYQLEDEKTMGYATLSKGINGKFKINGTNTGFNILEYNKIETNKGLYGYVVGQNVDNKIDHIKINLTQELYDFDVNLTNEEHFIKYFKFSDKINLAFPVEVILYDNNGNDITKELLTKYK